MVYHHASLIPSARFFDCLITIIYLQCHSYLLLVCIVQYIVFLRSNSSLGRPVAAFFAPADAGPSQPGDRKSVGERFPNRQKILDGVPRPTIRGKYGIQY
jgi:hypothetical protein